MWSLDCCSNRDIQSMATQIENSQALSDRSQCLVRDRIEVVVCQIQFKYIVLSECSMFKCSQMIMAQIKL
uniref:Ovule protein n=1 Tax=Panagrellus redivivus TaxID=6233 RepID=A0A7E4W1L9_PANRE